MSYIHLTELLPNPKCIVWAEKAWEALKDNSDLFGSSTVLLEVRTAFYAHKEHETIMRYFLFLFLFTFLLANSFPFDWFSFHSVQNDKYLSTTKSNKIFINISFQTHFF